jgi:pectin methylesterase-like acyl-CoA thioesterase
MSLRNRCNDIFDDYDFFEEGVVAAADDFDAAEDLSRDARVATAGVEKAVATPVPVAAAVGIARVGKAMADGDMGGAVDAAVDAMVNDALVAADVVEAAAGAMDGTESAEQGAELSPEKNPPVRRGPTR